MAELAETLAEFAEVDDGLLVLRWWLWSEGEEDEDMGLAAALDGREKRRGVSLE